MTSLNETASWVIRRKSDGKVMVETFNVETVNNLNTDEYEAVPILEYLGSINGQGEQS